MHAAELRVDPEEARAALAQLVDLGYIDPLGADDEATRRDTVASNRLQLAQSLVDAGERPSIAEVLRTAAQLQPRQQAPHRHPLHLLPRHHH
jgi:hypothetical protein